ncbi:hypothetical protein FNF28_06390 [Cafeteria roenbergensis]|uniref:Tyrosine specific protein phosphatases domain-containing protein n=1 Tax=Cafeteria roenbergensis TaxID=33653 RepID=A0A5A8D1A8_CAFRO|nr:hypothetical protein FNF28_06390 [Cafeteria roenbergensis]
MFRRMGDFVASVRTAAAALNLDRLQADDQPVARTYGELNLTVLAPRLVAMGFPSQPPDSASGVGRPGPRSRNPVSLVEAFLASHFGEGHCLIIDVGETDYDPESLSKAGPVVSYRFPGHTAPPLGITVGIVRAAEAWLRADPANAVAVHCMTGKGRTAVTCAAISAWIARGVVRACAEFQHLLDGVRPHSRVLVLSRVMVSSALPTIDGEPLRPLLEVFKGGRLLWSSKRHLPITREAVEAEATAHRPSGSFPPLIGSAGSADSSAAAGVEMGPDSFKMSVGLPVRGDLLLRCRHLPSEGGAPVTAFRVSVHVGYIPGFVLRLGRSGVDVSPGADAWSPDTLLELTFAAAGAASQRLADDVATTGGASVGTAAELKRGGSADSGTLRAALLAEEDGFWDSSARSRSASSADASGTAPAAMVVESHHHTRFGIGDDDDDDNDDGVAGGETAAAASHVSDDVGMPDDDLDAEFGADFVQPAAGLGASAASAATTAGAADDGDLSEFESFLDEMGS